MSDRLFFALSGLAAVAMIALALAWPTGGQQTETSETVSRAVSAAVEGDLR